jgi:hypothetical protein
VYLLLVIIESYIICKMYTLNNDNKPNVNESK